MKNLVTIITVGYNRVATLQRVIDSVALQTYDNIESIIVDGGSTDGTVELSNQKNDRISRWISEPDKGIYNAMNKGIRLATGDIIGIINSDDWYESDAVETVVNTFKKTDADILYGNLNLVDGVHIYH